MKVIHGQDVENDTYDLHAERRRLGFIVPVWNKLNFNLSVVSVEFS